MTERHLEGPPSVSTDLHEVSRHARCLRNGNIAEEFWYKEQWTVWQKRNRHKRYHLKWKLLVDVMSYRDKTNTSFIWYLLVWTRWTLQPWLLPSLPPPQCRRGSRRAGRRDGPCPCPQVAPRNCDQRFRHPPILNATYRSLSKQNRETLLMNTYIHLLRW